MQHPALCVGVPNQSWGPGLNADGGALAHAPNPEQACVDHAGPLSLTSEPGRPASSDELSCNGQDATRHAVLSCCPALNIPDRSNVVQEPQQGLVCRAELVLWVCQSPRTPCQPSTQSTVDRPMCMHKPVQPRKGLLRGNLGATQGNLDHALEGMHPCNLWQTARDCSL